MRVLIHVVPGLEEVARDEVRELIPAAEAVGQWRGFDERTSILELKDEGPPEAWLALGTAEDVFALAVHGRAISSGREGLGALAAATLSSKLLDRALEAHAACRGRRARTFRVVARMSGRRDYRRLDAQNAVIGALKKRLPRLHPQPEDADLEFWLSLVGGDALVGLRLSTRAMRGAEVSDLATAPASLKPTVARAMVRLSRPRADDVVLDPFCGAGTLLVERGAAGDFAALRGGDQDPAAVARARRNLRAAELSAHVERWDARALPLPDASVDVVLTNPPFGKRVEIPGGDPARFYGQVVGEMRRALKPGGRAVLVTSQADAFHDAGRAAGLRVRRRIPLLLRGERAVIFVAVRA